MSARPWVENLLHAYADLCDERDAGALALLLADADVRFGEGAPVTGRAAVASLYEGLFADAHRTRHLLSNLVVTGLGVDQVVTRTVYTRWILDPEPALVGMGQYQSQFTCRDGRWTFTGHDVRRDWFLEQR